MSTATHLRLFQAFGVELEYMIVDAQTLSILPIADQVLRDADGRIVSDVDLGEITWSNELVLHVIELKTTGPAPALEKLSGCFQSNVAHINRLLAPLGGRLMPTAMHPWMDPLREARLWPHAYNAVYESFHRIFDCRGHGWSNLQSVHLNLPFGDADEFGRLHAAIRLVLPVLPALAASSPVVESRLTGLLDNRMEFYRHNSRKIPSLSGLVIPEPVFMPDAYQNEILQRIYRDLAPYDPEGLLQDEFANARGAIARFERGSIEIRVLDAQECPSADLAVCQAATAVLRGLIDQQWSDLARQQAMETDPLAEILLATVRDADQAILRDREYLALLGFPGHTCTAGELWKHLIASTGLLSRRVSFPWMEALRVILEQGPLARRIVKRLDGNASADRLRALYGELCDCLAGGETLVV